MVHLILGSGDTSYLGALYHPQGNDSFPYVCGESRFALYGIKVGTSDLRCRVFSALIGGRRN